MHTTVSGSDLDHLGKWLRSKHGDLTASWSRIPLSVRLPGKDHCFQLDPFGYLFDEITA